MVAILSGQREVILEAVRGMYTEVATQPAKTFHFPTGRSACEFVGYPAEELNRLPEGAVESFAGVGYPFAVGVIESGDAVLDIGAGSGTDALIASVKAGPAGTVYALDMTEAMLAKLERTLSAAGVANLRAVRGTAEEIPLPDGSVDVVTSNGVLNLVPNKPRCVAEIWRVLRPGGYAQIADIALGAPVSEACRLDPKLWAECVVGATLESQLLQMFRDAGFEVGLLGRMDYFAGSPSPETRSVAASFGGRSVVLWAEKPPLGRKARRSSAWPRAASASRSPSEEIPATADVLEAHGVSCGTLEPMMRTRIRALESGQVLEVRSDEPGARLGIPSWSRLTGHALIATHEGEGGTVRYFLRRK